MQYCVDHREELNKLAKVEAQITEIKGVMVDNIEKVGNLLFNLLDYYMRKQFTFNCCMRFSICS